MCFECTNTCPLGGGGGGTRNSRNAYGVPIQLSDKMDDNDELGKEQDVHREYPCSGCPSLALGMLLCCKGHYFMASDGKGR